MNWSRTHVGPISDLLHDLTFDWTIGATVPSNAYYLGYFDLWYMGDLLMYKKPEQPRQYALDGTVAPIVNETNQGRKTHGLSAHWNGWHRMIPCHVIIAVFRSWPHVLNSCLIMFTPNQTFLWKLTGASFPSCVVTHQTMLPDKCEIFVRCFSLMTRQFFARHFPNFKPKARHRRVPIKTQKKPRIWFKTWGWAN